MSFKPDRAFILAAGKGTRLKPYTDYVPKPMTEIAGKSLVMHALDRLEAAGVERAVINLHYKAQLLENHLRHRPAPPQLVFSHEKELMDTGGGIKKALPALGANPFFAISGDSLWTEGPGETALSRMAQAWDGNKMDLLLLLQPVEKMTLTQGVGDYDIGPDGKAVRSRDKKGAYMWTSVRLCKPDLFADSPDGPFSFLTLMDRAESQGRLSALVHDGDWHHISTADDLERVDAALSAPGPASAPASLQNARHG